MTQMDLFQTATSSQPDIRANHFHLPGSEEAQKMTDISGRTYFPLFKKNDALGAFSRMFLGTSLWGSTRCYLTWRGKATPRGRSLFQLVPRTHLTEEIDSGLSQEMWATPTTKGYGHASEGQVANLLKKVQNGKITMKEAEQMVGLQTLENHRTYKKMWPTPLAQEAKHGQVTQWEMETDHAATKNSLRVAVAKQMWPTPRASAGMNDSMQSAKKQVNKKGYKHKLEQAVAMWPTPRASEYKDTGPVGSKSHSHMQEKKYLCAAVKDPEQPLGSLNPQWVEWLMGYPEGWTDLED